MPTGQVILATLVVVLGGGGSYLLLPHRHGTTKTRTAHAAGALLAGLGLLIFLTFWSPPGPILSGLFFYVLSIAAVTGGLMTVTSRNPIYSALWFASVVLSTAGLFVLAGGQFLAAGTVIVYAGAIIVTFLFVIMLAQMEGKAVYDRSARAPGSATFTCFLLFWCLLYILGPLGTRGAGGQPLNAPANPGAELVNLDKLFDPHTLPTVHPVRDALSHAARLTSSTHDAEGIEKPNVAGLGEALYTDHLLTVELAGTLLFVALIAAVAITNPRRPQRPSQSQPAGLAARGF